MTTLTYVANTIMAYVGADADVVGVNGLVGLPDWGGASTYFLAFGNGATSGVRKFEIDPGGDETQQKKRSDIGVNWISFSSGGAATIAYDGTAIYFVSDPFNWSELCKINTSDLSLAAVIGVSSSFGSEDGSHVLDPSYMVTRNNGGAVELVTASLSNLERLTSVNAAFSTLTYRGALSEAVGGSVLFSGGGAVANHSVYAFGLPFVNGSDDADSGNYIGVYNIGASVTRVGQFKATDVDATWSRITSLAGGAYDETDGNLICGVQTSESSPTNKQYIIKISATTGAVLWTRAVNFLTSYQWGFAGSRIRNSRFHYLGASSLVYHINTTNGTVTTETVTGLTLSGAQYSDDVTNSIILYGDFTAGGSPPNYVGTYMGTGGHHNVSGWLRFWFATAAPPGGGTGGNQGGLAFSSVRAWTYTLDGHTFYVLDLGTEGTWAYDIGTGQWSRFYTNGYSGRWDAINGIMWGNRVVAGDVASTTVWEISADETKDNDGTDITHVVTGGLQTRSRVKHSVDAVRLVGSVGKLGTGTTADIKLRWSDDNGNSWSSYRTVTLTHGTHGTEIAWRSLGAFAAPGRVFDIFDTGGPVRIDGADAEVDGLDGNS